MSQVSYNYLSKYYILKEVPCHECNGTGWVTHWQWAKFWAEQNTSNEIETWFETVNGRNKYGIVNIPDEETICPNCEGEKVIRAYVDLSEALQWWMEQHGRAAEGVK